MYFFPLFTARSLHSLHSSTRDSAHCAQHSAVCTSYPACRGTAPLPARGNSGQTRPGLRRQVPGRGDRRAASTGPRSRRPGATAANPARGDDAIASPGRRRRHATALICTTAAASAGSRVMPSRTLPRVLSCSKEQAHAQNLDATARFHCSRLAWNDEIIALKSSLALSLPSFLPPSRASLNRKLALACTWIRSEEGTDPCAS